MRTGIATSLGGTPWRELYKAALFEADKSRLLEQIAKAENALVLRAHELFHTDGDHIEEEQALDDAMYFLRALRSIAGSFSKDRQYFSSVRDDASWAA